MVIFIQHKSYLKINLHIHKHSTLAQVIPVQEIKIYSFEKQTDNPTIRTKTELKYL